MNGRRRFGKSKDQACVHARDGFLPDLVRCGARAFCALSAGGHSVRRLPLRTGDSRQNIGAPAAPRGKRTKGTRTGRQQFDLPAFLGPCVLVPFTGSPGAAALPTWVALGLGKAPTQDFRTAQGPISDPPDSTKPLNPANFPSEFKFIPAMQRQDWKRSV